MSWFTPPLAGLPASDIPSGSSSQDLPCVLQLQDPWLRQSSRVMRGGRLALVVSKASERGAMDKE